MNKIITCTQLEIKKYFIMKLNHDHQKLTEKLTSKERT